MEAAGTGAQQEYGRASSSCLAVAGAVVGVVSRSRRSCALHGSGGGGGGGGARGAGLLPAHRALRTAAPAPYRSRAGTAGLRGKMGPGFSRMNVVTVQQSTQVRRARPAGGDVVLSTPSSAIHYLLTLNPDTHPSHIVTAHAVRPQPPRACAATSRKPPLSCSRRAESCWVGAAAPRDAL